MKFIFISVFICVAYAESSLELVHVFFRHGSRTPEEKDTYPTDPYTIKDFMPTGWGQLTNTGKLRAYTLGKLLRKRYNSFLGDIYTPQIAETTSTDFDRTKMTALLVLAGLFPPSPSQQWNEELPWNPIPYNMDKNNYDYFLRRPTHYCPRYVKELEKVTNIDVGALILKGNQNLLDYIAQHSGKPMETLLDVFRLYQTLNAEDTLNMTLPKWTENIYPEKIHSIAAKQCYLENSNAILKRLNGGRSLGKAIENMEAKTRNLSPGRKIYLYSGHENNVINILAALNLFEPHVPKYSSAAILELHSIKETATYGIKIFYVEDVNTDPEVLQMEGCDNLCPLNTFIEITRPHVPVNYTAECESNINLG